MLGTLVIVGFLKYRVVLVLVMFFVCLNNLFMSEEYIGIFIISELN